MSPFSLPLEIYHLALIFLRVGAVIMLLPAIGDAAVPQTVRLGFALMVTLCMTAVAGPGRLPGPSGRMPCRRCACWALARASSWRGGGR